VMVSGIGRGMGVLDAVVIIKGEEAVSRVNFGRPIVTNGDGDALFPNYFGEDLLSLYTEYGCDTKFTVFFVRSRFSPPGLHRSA